MSSEKGDRRSLETKDNKGKYGEKIIKILMKYRYLINLTAKHRDFPD